MSPTDLARNYVDCSNAHNLEAVLELFAPSPFYHSDSLGTFLGREQIETMMRDFYARHPGIRWEVDAYEEVESGLVAFRFRSISRDPKTGETVERSGTDRLRFDDRGKNLSVEVAVDGDNDDDEIPMETLRKS